jgi:type IV pilus assembly protein PilQ
MNKSQSKKWFRRRLTWASFAVFCALLLPHSVRVIAADDGAENVPDLEASLNEELNEGESTESGKDGSDSASISLDEDLSKPLAEGDESESENAGEPSVDDLLADVEPGSNDAKPKDSDKDALSSDPLELSSAGSATERLAERGVAEEAWEPYPVDNLEFRMTDTRSEIVLTSPRRPKYMQMQGNNSKQLVYLLEHAQTPERLQRAYDTSEFPSPVGLFTLFQIPGAATPTSKLIIQLREDSTPEVSISDKGIRISFPPPAEGGKEVVIGEKKQEILSGGNIYGTKQMFQGELIERLEIKNSDIQDVLRLIARTSGFNIVIGDDVTGSVGTLSLENIPWDQAFTLVLQSKKLSYVREGNVIRVGTTGSLKAEKDEAYRIEEASRRVEPLKTLLIPVSYAKAGTLAPRLTGLLSERGRVDTDERTNTIIIKDIESTINKAQKLISALDTPPPRVQVTARIMEVKNVFTRRLGFVRNRFTGRLGGVDFEQAAGFGTDGLSTTTISARDFGNLQATFAVSENRNEARLLANPTVVVVANQSATVTQTNTLFIPASTVVPGGTAVAQFLPIPVTLSLQVTPIVAGDGSIFMDLNINNGLRSTAPGGTFAVDVRNITTQILIENGGTAVIGGVFQNTVSTNRTGIPFLMDLPVLGYFFSERGVEEDKNQILIFLSARVLNAEESFRRTL